MSPLIRLLLVASLVLATTARADETKLLAVLPLDVTHSESKLSAAGRTSFEESIRDIAANSLSASGWIVMSGENALTILTENGVDPTKCDDQTCHLGLARELKVEKFVSGAVLFVDGQLQASIRLIDTRSGRIVGSERVTGATATELQVAFEGKAVVFFTRCGLIGTEVERVPPKERVLEPLSGLDFVVRQGLWETGAMIPVDVYSRCVWAGACFEPEQKTSESCNWKRRRSDPVNCLDSARARQFCEWIGGRLPTLTEAKRLTHGSSDLPAAFFEEESHRGVLRFEGEKTRRLESGEESVDPQTGFSCVLSQARAEAL